MKQIFDNLREQMHDRIKWFQTMDTTDVACDVAIKETERFIEYINESETKWEKESQKHDIEVRNKAIAEFEEQMKFEYRESVGTTKRERHFAEAVIEQVAHSLTEVE